MKTFKEFCVDANIQENWFDNFRNAVGSLSKPKPSQQVLAYRNYQPGVLDKSTGKFTQRAHTGPEQQRYRWIPVKTSSYGPQDTPSQSYNTGKDNVQKTASGTVFTPSSRGVAVPYKYRQGEVPKGTWAGTPSVPFGTRLQLTQKPSGTNTRVTNAPVVDTGNFGPAGEVNRSTGLDLMQGTARQLTGKPDQTPTDYGKRTVYVRTAQQPQPPIAKSRPKK